MGLASAGFAGGAFAGLALVRPHGDDGVDGPCPILGGAAPKLNANRADLDLEAVAFVDDAAIVERLEMNILARAQVHLAAIRPARGRAPDACFGGC